MAAKVLMAIDYESLCKCKEASREMNEYLQNERVLWKQIISMNVSGKPLLATRLVQDALGNKSYSWSLILSRKSTSRCLEKNYVKYSSTNYNGNSIRN